MEMNQDQFAKPLGIKGKTISALETGKQKNPSEAVLKLIEIEYLINRKWLLTGKGDKHLSAFGENKFKIKNDLLENAKKLLQEKQKEINVLESLIDCFDNQKNRIRETDPPGKKDELLKMRIC